MTVLHNVKRIVIKVGTSTLIHPTGKVNIRKMERLVSVIADIVNSGIEVALVTSGAIGVGVGKLGFKERPTDTPGRQAIATVGQCELMFLYDKIFGEYGHTIGQLLITKGDVENEQCAKNLINTFKKLFEYKAVPVVNENDSVAIEEIVYGDNDTLSAVVAKLIGADALIIVTDIDGLYDSDPSKNKDAKLIPVVWDITNNIYDAAGENGTKFSTGGMMTKLEAARIAMDGGIDTVIINGDDMDNIYRAIDGEEVGTFFAANKNKAL